MCLSVRLHQLETRKQKDWVTPVIKDLNKFEKNITVEKINNISKDNWKKIVNRKSI